jgi:glycosyltransferase involved in cell wall biosynthesis
MSTPPPKVIVAILTYKRTELLGELLSKLIQEQASNTTYSILVVDNDHAGSGRPVFDAATQGLPSAYYVVEAARGIPRARNRALRVAAEMGADFLAFIDDDALPATGWIDALLRCQAETGAQLVGGPQRVAPLRPPADWVQRWIHSSLRICEIQNEKRNASRNRKGRVPFIATNNWLVDMRWLGGSGLRFNERWRYSGGSDALFLKDFYEAGGKAAWAEDAAVYEVIPTNRLSFKYQIRRSRSQSNNLFRIKHPQITPDVILRKLPMVALRAMIGCLLVAVPLRGSSSALRGIQAIGWSLGRMDAMRGKQSTLYAPSREDGRSSRPSDRSVRPGPAPVATRSERLVHGTWSHEDTAPAAPLASAFGDRLWGGFSRDALRDLTALEADHAASIRERAMAAHILGLWYAMQEKWEIGLRYAEREAVLDPDLISRRGLILRCECLRKLDRAAEARALAGEEFIRTDDHQLRLLMANIALSDKAPDSGARVLDLWNPLYQSADFEPLALRDPAQPFCLDNLCAPGAILAANGHRPTVSVIVPLFNAAGTIEMALRGLAEQTWRELEIVVVDDCSTDDGPAKVERAALSDPRIKLIRKDKNGGSYQCRNLALSHISGDFITVHDGDDWSHPQRIEAQVRPLLKNENMIGSMCSWIRIGHCMDAQSVLRRMTAYLHLSHSSLLVRRSVMEALGGWDAVRIAADTEFMWRLEKAFGTGKIAKVARQTPLILALFQENSLTRASNTHLMTIFHGVRRLYKEHSLYWHERADDLKLDLMSNLRTFPAPGIIMPERSGQPTSYDVLYVTDFALIQNELKPALNFLNAAIAAGLRVAVFDWRRYDRDVTQAMSADILELAAQGSVFLVAPGEKLRVDTVIVGTPVILQSVVDRFPETDFANLFLVSDPGEGAVIDAGLAMENLREIFGGEGEWRSMESLTRSVASPVRVHASKVPGVAV